ncbi:MAG: TrkH family potassium uptake protein [Bacteroidales bacterium]|nr:MAG: TrkH family potassium uptake protein [Bacteroidales bacterium]
MINFKVVSYILGVLLIIEAIFMLLSVSVSLMYGENDYKYLLISSLIVLVIGLILFLLFKTSDKSLGKREGYIIVSLGWIVFSIFGAIPFYISGSIPSYTDAFFETMSGFTTTGASILRPEEYEMIPNGLMFWRCLTQWLGGMGIIVLSLSILPILGIGGMQLFVAEVPGPAPDKLHPRIKETAKRLWGIYFIFTLSEMLLLRLGGMSFFDAICHSFTTMATGGYSTNPNSITYFSPYIQYVIIVFMFLAGTNFTLSYLAMHFKLKQVINNEEFRFYLFFIFLFSIIITFVLRFTSVQSIENSFRHSLFQVVSILTTTGYTTTDYLKWAPIGITLIFLLMFFGGSAGSTGGSIKIIRVVLLLKNSILELKRLIHPNAVIPVRLNSQAVSSQIVTNVLAFVSFYILTVMISTGVISALGYNLESSLGAVAATLGNIGPGIGAVGPAENYADIPVFGKWFLSFLMLIGRLELFTVLILFAPSFWRK